MKKSTKIISAVLASLMLVAAGCGSDKPAEKKTGRTGGKSTDSLFCPQRAAE